MASTEPHDYEDDQPRECEGWGSCDEPQCPCHAITEITEEGQQDV